MVLMPPMGAFADVHAKKKRMLAVVSAGCMLGTVALPLVGPDDLALALAAIAISTFCFSAGVALNSAFLPELAKPDALGRVSGWAFGDPGGLLALGFGLGCVHRAQADGQTATPFRPRNDADHRGRVRACRGADVPVRARARGAARRRGGDEFHRRIGPTDWADAEAHAPVPRFRLADGVRFPLPERNCDHDRTRRNLRAAGDALHDGADDDADPAGQYHGGDRRTLFGYVQDAIGDRATLAITIAEWVALVPIAAAWTGTAGFWIAATIAGLCMGSSPSAGRAMEGAFAPTARLTQFYLLWNVAAWLRGVAGAVTYGFVTWMTGNNRRLAILVTGASFVIGLALLALIDVERGRAAAQAI
jgi:MFS transporter, UMF1 family